MFSTKSYAFVIFYVYLTKAKKYNDVLMLISGYSPARAANQGWVRNG